jgi:hypothetical protein
VLRRRLLIFWDHCSLRHPGSSKPFGPENPSGFHPSAPSNFFTDFTLNPCVFRSFSHLATTRIECNSRLVVYPKRRHDCMLELRLRDSGCAARGVSCLCTSVFAPYSSRLEPAVFSFSFPHPPLPCPSLSLGFSQPILLQFFATVTWLHTFMLLWLGWRDLLSSNVAQ